MRRMTLLWLFLAALSGGTLYHTSQQVTDGHARLATINDDIRKENETIRVLQAEWSYLNQPDRLEKLSRQYLHLQPLQGRQFAKLGDIPAQPATATPDAPPAVAAAAPDAAKVAAKPEIKKPEARVAAKAPVVKISKPLPAPVLHEAAPVATAERAPDRSFGDVIKSLGVR